MKPTFYLAALLLLHLSACPAPLPPGADKTPEPSASAVLPESPEPSTHTHPLIITSETKDPKLPQILFPGLELKVIAGTGEAGYRDGEALEAQFNIPSGLTMNEASELFIADVENHCIRKLNRDYQVSSILCKNKKQNYNDILVNENIKQPSRLKYHNKALILADFSTLYYFDLFGQTLKPLVTGLKYNDSNPFFDSAIQSDERVHDMLIFNEHILMTLGNNTVQRLNFDTDQLEHIAGNVHSAFDYSINPYQYYVDGPALEAIFNAPTGIAAFSSTQILISDARNHRIRVLDFALGNPIVSTLAGKESRVDFGDILLGGFKDGPLHETHFNAPSSLAIGPNESTWVSDAGNNALRVIFNNQVVTIIKNISIGGFYFLKNKLYISDRRAHYIYEMDLSQFDFSQLTPQVLENEAH